MMDSHPRLKQLVILSGKGGTGKTTLAAALVQLASKSAFPTVFVDADVDAANLALVTNAKTEEAHPFTSSTLAVIDKTACSLCGNCFDVCRYDAIHPPHDGQSVYQVVELLCDGCAACVHCCPEKAIEMIPQQDGEWYRSSTPYGVQFHAELFPAAENTGKLVTLIKQHAKLHAEDHKIPLMIVDGPPGIGCPVISASAGADLALLAAEPGVSGVHDLGRIIQTLTHFKIPSMICINKADISSEGTTAIHELAAGYGYPVVGEIPFDPAIPQAMVAGQPVTQYSPDAPASEAVQRIWKAVLKAMFPEGVSR